MKIYTSIFLFYIIIFLSACSSSHIITAWKAKNIVYEKYNRIMVAGITGTGNDSFQLLTEKYFVSELRNIGYDAFSALEEFGPKGFTNMTEAETYIKLCNKGVDVVITIALVDCSKEKKLAPGKSYDYPSDYYYNRIWNYKNIQPDLNAGSSNKAGYFWESIVFNLRTLEAECTVQTKTFYTINQEKMAYEFEKRIIKKMIREKVLRVQKPDKLKPF